jgi:hypothetical protein
VPGKKVANSFLEVKQEHAVIIVPPSYTFLYYYPSDEPIESLPDEGQDLKNSKFLIDVDVEKASEVFLESLYNELRKFDLKVFTADQFDEFLMHDGPRNIFNIAQAEMIEFDSEYTDRALIDTVLYRQSFLLRTIERNTWFEYTRVNDTDEDQSIKVLYSTFFTSDDINGNFRYRPFSGDVFYEYSSYLITQEDIYELNRFAGEKNAQYIFDFLLNKYIEDNSDITPENRKVFFRYSRPDNEIKKAGIEQRFIELKPSVEK